MAPKRSSTSEKPGRKRSKKDIKEDEIDDDLPETYCVVIDDPNAIDYSSKKYWDSRYDKNDIDHEWYFNFETLEPIFERIISQSKIFGLNGKSANEATALEIGCGDRPIINHLASLDFQNKNLHAIDFSDIVINQLKASQPTKFDQEIQFLEADARRLNSYYSDNFFKLIIDKGTIDAMLSESSTTKAINNAREIVESVVNVLALNGVYVLISHIQVDTDEFSTLMEDIIMPALEGKQNKCHWQIEAHIADNQDSKKKRGKKGKKGQDNDNSFGTVYIFYAKERKTTRHSEASSDITFDVIDHSEN